MYRGLLGLKPKMQILTEREGTFYSESRLGLALRVELGMLNAFRWELCSWAWRAVKG